MKWFARRPGPVERGSAGKVMTCAWLGELRPRDTGIEIRNDARDLKDWYSSQTKLRVRGGDDLMQVIAQLELR